MKHHLNSVLRHFGMKMSSYTKSPFENLLSFPRYQEIEIDLLGHKVAISDSLSFYYSHREIFIDEIYKFTCNKKQPIILDCGSNHGVSIMYFKKLYPNAKIVGVEADPNIYRLLRNNIFEQNYENVTLLNSALCHKAGTVLFFSEGADGGRIHDMENPTQTCEINTVTLDELIDGEIDFLKMDIEGAETDVICASTKIGCIKQMFIEYHSFNNAGQTLSKLLEKLSINNFRYYLTTVHCPEKPFQNINLNNGMDLQLNIFAIRNGIASTQ